MDIKDEKNALKNILIKGANIHNLNNIDVIIPKNKLVIVTGVSGSGKSSLTIDTIYAEGQRRYVESLSSYARQFLNRMDKPDVEYIKGLAPAIAIEQRANSSSSRSTVGTLTELYDYLRLLFAKIGVTYSPVSGKIVSKHNTNDILNFIQSHGERKKYLILSPLVYNKQIDVKEEMEYLIKVGFLRLYLKK
jgi:excinuclease ABC subunit A